jgi:hypothetical protein
MLSADHPLAAVFVPTLSIPFPTPLCCLGHSAAVVSSPHNTHTQVRAMQIIDELEVHKRGPYGGGLGVVGFSGELALGGGCWWQGGGGAHSSQIAVQCGSFALA